MRKGSPWYLLFMAALAAGSVFWLRDFVTVIVIMSFTLSDSFCLRLDKTQQRKWLIPCGILLALFLGASYYIAELIIFPHSANAAYRLRNSCCIGLILAAGGLATAYWSPANRRLRVGIN